MKVFRFVPVLLLVALVWLPFSQPALAQTLACPNATLSPDIPHEVELRGEKPIQKDFDCFSWQSLVGLSWAATADANGEPDRSIPFGQVGSRGLVVWQTYKNWDAVFPQNDNPNPCPDGTDNCWNTPLAGGENLYMTSKSGGFLDGQFESLPNAWLTAQNGQLTRYEILVNEDEFEFVIDNKLYDGTTQTDTSFEDGKDINMPEGINGGPVGPMELKAAWKILSDNDDPSKYFSTVATIQDTKVNPENGYPQPNGGVYMTCKGSANGICQRPVGLVGFHIAHKVKDNPQWVWSTFEQKNNVPIQGEADPHVTYSYFKHDCGDSVECTENTNPRELGLTVNTPNQVARYLASEEYGGDKILPQDVNSQWQELLAGTVWENYELISTQWPTDPQNKTECNVSGIPSYQLPGCPTPPILANTTMETYIQGDRGGPKFASSCIGCHQYGAQLNGRKADFSYLFSRAKPN